MDYGLLLLEDLPARSYHLAESSLGMQQPCSPYLEPSSVLNDADSGSYVARNVRKDSRVVGPLGNERQYTFEECY